MLWSPLLVPAFKCTLPSLRQFLATESPLKMMKNAPYLILKAFLVLKIFVFVLNFWSYQKMARLERYYNTRNIFLEKSYTKQGGCTIPRPFSKKSKLSISLHQYI